MKIWILTSSFPANPQDARAAAGLFVADFAVALAEAGHEVSVVTPDKQPGEKRDPPGVEVDWFAGAASTSRSPACARISRAT